VRGGGRREEKRGGNLQSFTILTPLGREVGELLPGCILDGRNRVGGGGGKGGRDSVFIFAGGGKGMRTHPFSLSHREDQNTQSMRKGKEEGGKSFFAFSLLPQGERGVHLISISRRCKRTGVGGKNDSIEGKRGREKKRTPPLFTEDKRGGKNAPFARCIGKKLSNGSGKEEKKVV